MFSSSLDNLQPLIQFINVTTVYKQKVGLLKSSLKLHALDDISLSLYAGKTLVIVGESGSGKSTLGQLITGDLIPTSGQVLIKGKPSFSMTRKERARLVQPIVQDPSTALNPHWKISRLLYEPFAIHSDLDADPPLAIKGVLEATRLPEKILDKFPHELSGGQQQRVAIARALLLKPDILVCDEAVSALDAPVQQDIVTLLKTIQSETGMTIVFITHDLHLVPKIADSVAVLYLGTLMEIGLSQSVVDGRLHPYTEALFGSSPKIGKKHGLRTTLKGEPPSLVERPSGCVFHPRCNDSIGRCSLDAPTFHLVDIERSHKVRCHFFDKTHQKVQSKPVNHEVTK